jgi:ABC-type Fe3+-hydroxamate transport system substrate-binding protein
VDQLALHYPVWVTDVNNLEDALKMIADVGTMTGKLHESKRLIEEISLGFDKLAQRQTQNPKFMHRSFSEGGPKTAYLIWRKPYMTIGADTFIHDMLMKCGFENIFADKTRYPEVSIAELATASCQLLLLSSEPYPFKQKHIDELSSSLPGTRIILVDGEFFSWYGSRLLHAPAYFTELINSIK